MIKTFKKPSMLILAIILILIPMVIAHAEGNQGEYVTINYDNSIPTNQNVTISFELIDQASGVDKLMYINEGVETSISLTDEAGNKKGSFLVEENGEYNFKAYDIAKNETLAKVVITNIDKVLPEMTLTQNPTQLTNQDVVITVNATDNVAISKIILPDNTEVEMNTTEYSISENGTYEFKAIDTAGNEIAKSIEISNINKVKPELTVDYDDNLQEWTNQDITVTATATKGTLNEETHTFIENGSFTFIATDEYGNTEQCLVTVTKIDKIPPKINITKIK